jgi:hypothetical protein
VLQGGGNRRLVDQLDFANASPAELLAFCIAAEVGTWESTP